MHEINLSYHCIMGQINSSELLRKLVADLRPYYDHEAQSIAMILLEEVLQLSRNEIILNHPVELDAATKKTLDECKKQLQNKIPIQHILGWADFYGYRFIVNENVLIPRQETEELVHMVSELIRNNAYSTILDIGTGSGCIAISLALENRNTHVTGVDVSREALEISIENASKLNAKVDFLELDILTEDLNGVFDVIVSNPPYVMNSEKTSLPENVLNHDPDLALFVPDEQPLLFYRRITEVANNHLRKGGLLFFEINEKFGPEVTAILRQKGFDPVTLLNDINTKPRFVLGYKN